MEFTQARFAQIEHCLPRQRGNVGLTNLSVLNAILYVAGHGCKWRGLPKRFGNRHTIHTRMNRWSGSGVLDRVFEEFQRAQVVRSKMSPGQAHDAPEGRALPSRLGPPDRPLHLPMDRAHEGNETRQLALDLGFVPVVPPKENRSRPGKYDREVYRTAFRRLKARAASSQFEKLDVMFVGSICFALIADGLRLC